MEFTEKEILFLLDRHTVECATGQRITNASVDLRSLGCPVDVFERILRHRARQLGKRFTEFRNSTRNLEREPVTLGNMDSLEALKLF